MNQFNHTRPVRDESGAIVGQKPAPVSRLTVSPLGGLFGSDKSKRLVVTLLSGDVIEVRPERTRRAVSMEARDLYRYLLRCQANKEVLERARVKKAKRAEQRESRRIAAADRRLRAELRAERGE